MFISILKVISIKRFVFSMVTLHPSCRNHSSSNNSTISCFMSYGVSRSFCRGRHCRNCVKSWNCKAHGVHLSASTPVFTICHYLQGICHVIQRWHTRRLPANHNYEAPTWNRVLNLPRNFRILILPRIKATALSINSCWKKEKCKKADDHEGSLEWNGMRWKVEDWLYKSVCFYVFLWSWMLFATCMSSSVRFANWRFE